MKRSNIEQILDDAVDLMAGGCDPQLCAEQWPAHRHEIEPLLHVAHQLLSYAQDSAPCLHQAGASGRQINWVALLADVPQAERTISKQPVGQAMCPDRKHGAAGRRRAKPRVAGTGPSFQ